MSLKKDIVDNVKNLPGWRTKRKIVVFSVDDYGNVRLASKEARENLDKAGMKVLSRFDAYDTLETREDLEMLYEVLNSVRDKNDNPAVFTPFAVPCNIDFERIIQEDFKFYRRELLIKTFERLETEQPLAYKNAWSLWKVGIEKGFMAPQFHGREHLNLKVFEEKLAKRDRELVTALKNHSYTSISDSGYSTISVTAAFDFWDIKENEKFGEIIDTGVEAFTEVFGYKPIHFNAPGAAASSLLHEPLRRNGVLFSDNPVIKKEHLGFGKYKTRFNYTGKQLSQGITNINRNVVFEPGADNNIDWVNYTLKQIETAFRWGKPAVISSHRVNFCTHINPKAGKDGVGTLKKLLQEIVDKWPDVEFMSSSNLISISQNQNKNAIN